MTNLLPILIVGAAAVIVSGKKKPGKKASKKASKKADCTSEVKLSAKDLPLHAEVIRLEGGGEIEVRMPKVAVDEWSMGNRDIIDITYKTLEKFMPKHCWGDKSIRVVSSDDSGGSSLYNAPSVFTLIAAELAEDFRQTGRLNTEEGLRAEAAIINWWDEHMPNTPLPND